MDSRKDVSLKNEVGSLSESIHSLYDFERAQLGTKPDETRELKAICKELVQMQRKRSQNKKLFFDEIRDLNNLVLSSSFEDMNAKRNTGTSNKYKSKNAKENSIVRKLNFEEPNMVEN